MLDILDKEILQDTQEWLDIRKKCVTATDMSVLMLVSPYKTPYQLFEEKLGYRIQPETEAMRKGKELEPHARQKLSEKFGVELNPRVCFHASIPWMMASLDAIDDNNKYLCEIKCGQRDFELARDGLVPEHHMPQLQWQMYVSGMPHMFYYGYTIHEDVLIPVMRDDDLIKMMIIKAKEFYKCLECLEPPALTPKDIVHRDDLEWQLAAENYRSHKNQIFIAETRMEEARKRLIEMAGDHCTEGSGVKVIRCPRKGNIDYKAIPELSGVDINSYRKETTISWRVI